jgi:hypothetical protein
VAADDEARPDHERPGRQCRLDRLLAERFQRAVAGVDVLARWVFGPLYRRHLGQELGLLVHGDARDEDVPLGERRKQLGRGPDDAGIVSAQIDHGVVAATTQRREIGPAVAHDVPGLREELRVRQPAGEESELVPAGESRLDEVTADERRAAENEQLHRLSLTFEDRTCSEATLRGCSSRPGRA